MRVEVPDHVREAIGRQREADELGVCAQHARRREAKREEGRIGDLKRPLARRALEWARALADTVKLPSRGLEVFRGGKGRVRVTASVLPDGALVLIHVVAPFGGSRVEARRVRELVKASLDDLEQLVAAIESGEAWGHVERV